MGDVISMMRPPRKKRRRPRFKVSDVACLTGGGTLMTVTDVDPISGDVLCQWHSKLEEPREETYPESALLTKRQMQRLKHVVEDENGEEVKKPPRARKIYTSKRKTK